MKPDHPAAPEQRTIDVDVSDLDTRGRTVVGYAAVFDAESGDLGGFRERIAKGAFRSVLASADLDCRALLNHDPNQILGRTRSGTLRLAEDERGLRMELDLPESPLGDNVRTAVARGDLDGASFRFVVGRDSWSGDMRTVEDVAELQDCALASYPAYPQASIELRTRPDRDNTPAQGEEEEMRTKDRESGALVVEDRAAVTSQPTVEERVVEALTSIPKGEARALTTTSAGALTPTEQSTFLYDRLRPRSALLDLGLTVITTDKDSISVPQLTTDVDPAWVAEAAQIPAGDPAFATLTATPHKLAHRVIVSNEALDDSEPSLLDILNNHLSAMLALKLDRSLITGSGTAPEIRGIQNVVGIQTVAFGGANGASLTNLDPIADAIGLLEAANVPPPYAAIAPPRTWAAIRKLKDTTNAPLLTATPATDAALSVFGLPVRVSSQLPVNETQGSSTDASSIYVLAPRELVFVNRLPSVIELDRSRLFDTDQSELRAKLRCDLLVPNPAAIVRVTGVRP